MTAPNQTLDEFIFARKAEIKSQLAALRSELRRLEAAEAAARSVDAPQAFEKAASEPPPDKAPTIKAMILAVLAGVALGLSAEEIIEKIKEQFGKDVPRSSVSPQLTRLKNDDEVIRENHRWKLPEFAQVAENGVSNPSVSDGDAEADEDRADRREEMTTIAPAQDAGERWEGRANSMI